MNKQSDYRKIVLPIVVHQGYVHDQLMGSDDRNISTEHIKFTISCLQTALEFYANEKDNNVIARKCLASCFDGYTW